MTHLRKSRQRKSHPRKSRLKMTHLRTNWRQMRQKKPLKKMHPMMHMRNYGGSGVSRGVYGASQPV